MNMACLRERLLRSNQFSYGIPGRVHQIIMCWTIALKCNATSVLGEFDLKSAHTYCSRGLI